jgi:energy-coupling factor transport system ATP-binding protein
MSDDGQSNRVLEQLSLAQVAEANPRDLSTGERQRVALATLLVAKPKLLLLDEPTRGLDYQLKQQLGEILQGLQQQGLTILLVTHDVEFAAEYAQKVVLMSQGTVIGMGDKTEMLTRSTFYSPQVSKLFYHINDEIVTLAQGREVLRILMGKI